METVPCPICGSTVSSRFMDVPDRFDATGEKRWTLVQCPCSGFIMLNPRPGPQEIGAFYPSGLYGPHLSGSGPASPGTRAYLAARRLLLRYRASFVLKNSRTPLHELSILEVGCSTGELLGFLNRKKGIPLTRLAGIETDAAAAVHAREQFGLDIHPEIPGCAWEQRAFDRIVLWHALEHIHAIGETLERLKRLLRKDGVMVIALPNPACPEAALYRENWVAWDAPRHLYHFTPGTLEKLLEKHGLRISESMPYFPDAIFNIVYSEKLAGARENKPVSIAGLPGASLKAAWRLPLNSFDPGGSPGIVYFVRRE
jgi:SAM-dependent methyltransferase